MDPFLLFLVLFAVGTLVLLHSKQEKYFIVFLIRTQYFTPVIDWIANLSPRFWKLLADLSVVVSFGGLGAAYLSGYRREGRNLDVILFMLCVAALSMWSGFFLDMGVFPGIVTLWFLFLVLVAAVQFLSYAKNPLLDFVFSTALMALIFTRFTEALFSVLGISLSVPIYISLVEGAFGIPPLLIGMFLQQAFDILFKSSNLPGVAPILPAVRGGEVGVAVPGYPIFVPLIYAVIAFMILLVSHEFAHGVLARVHKVKIKSTGIMTFGIIPIGAFVEPDEKELAERPSIEKMRVFSAGSFANLLVCAACVLLMLSLSFFFVDVDGVAVKSVSENSTLKDALSSGAVIHRINGQEIRSVASYNQVLENISAGSPVSISTDAGNYTATAALDPGNGTGAYLGFSVENNIVGRYGVSAGILQFLWTLLGWIVFFNFNVALVNVLPVAPFDGWRMLREVMFVFKVSEQTARRIVYAIVSFSLLLLVINMIPLFNMVFSYVEDFILLHM